ncbi:MAG TPA: IS1595 family transposase [Bacteroidia bacterium]|jgi:transposase-like protein|nr:IS1595 family transposase [Bacteroidia bacterium]
MQNFKSLPQLLDYFKDESTCIKYYEEMRWKGNPICPHCDSPKPYVTNRGYKCSDSKCKKKFTVKVGTIFENSKISFRIWFAAMYLSITHKKGISSIQLANDLGITQKTAWFVLHRLRIMFENQAPQNLSRDKIIECDETQVGGKERNRHWGKKRDRNNPGFANDGSRYNKKKVVFGMVERGGNVIIKHVPDATIESLVPIIHKCVPHGTNLITDEHVSYIKLKYNYFHQYVNHSRKHYVQRDTYTNTIESFWAILKRGIIGVYHQVSEKHLHRYLSEFAARYNSRNMNFLTRLEQFLSNSDGRLTYKVLTL